MRRGRWSALETGAEALRRTWVAPGPFRFHAAYLDDGPHRPHSLVALHGLASSHNDFRAFRAPCEKSDIRLLVPNFPGVGFTPLGDHEEEFEHTTAEVAEFIGAFMDATSPKVDVLAAYSSGAIPALRLLADEPWRARLLVLVNPNGLRTEWSRSMTVAGVMARLWKLRWLRPLLGKAFQLICNHVFGLPEKTVAASSVRLQTMARAEWRSLPGAAARIAQAQTPVLLLYSDTDTIVRPELSEELAQALLCRGQPVEHRSDDRTVLSLSRRLAEGETRHAVVFPGEKHDIIRRHPDLVVRLAKRCLLSLDKHRPPAP